MNFYSISPPRTYSKLHKWLLIILVSFFWISEFNACVLPPGNVLCEQCLHDLDEKGPYYIRIYVHVIRDGNCNGGQTQQAVERPC